MVLHHPEALSELDPAGEGACEAAHRLAVGVADEGPALLAGPLAVGLEREPLAALDAEHFLAALEQADGNVQAAEDIEVATETPNRETDEAETGVPVS